MKLGGTSSLLTLASKPVFRQAIINLENGGLHSRMPWKRSWYSLVMRLICQSYCLTADCLNSPGSCIYSKKTSCWTSHTWIEDVLDATISCHVAQVLVEQHEKEICMGCNTLVLKCLPDIALRGEHCVVGLAVKISHPCP